MVASVCGHVPSFPPLAPPHALVHDITHYLLPTHWVGRFGCLWWVALCPFGHGLPPLLPIVMGIPCLSGCERPLLILAFTLFKLSAYHGLITRHTPVWGQFSLMTIDARTACCPSFLGVLLTIPVSSPALGRAWVDLSCLDWSPNCLLGHVSSCCPQLGQSCSVAGLLP